MYERLLRGLPVKALRAVPLVVLPGIACIGYRALCSLKTKTPEPTPAACCTPTSHGKAAAEGGAHSFVTIPHSEESFECYVARPPEGQPARGVVLVVHDIFGLRSGRHLQICDELASAGFVAACPDLFGDGAERAASFDPDWNAGRFAQLSYMLWNFGWMMEAFKLGKQLEEVIAPKLRATLSHCAGAHQEPQKLDSCAAVGFCWGGSVVARLLSESQAAKLPLRLTTGVGFHPSHRGWDAADVAYPLLLAPAGDDQATVQPGGKIAQPLIDRFGAAANVPFPDMRHGWMTRGPLDDGAVARDYRRGMELMISWLGESMPEK